MFPTINMTRILLQFLAIILLVLLHQHGNGFSGSCVTGSKASIFVSPNYDEIEQNLFLGNAKAASDRRILYNLNITHVLTIDNRPISKRAFHKLNITNLFIKAGDSPDQRIMPYFPVTNAFIEEGVNYGAVFVHCHHGISRSAALVIAYCMEKYNISYDKAFRYVRNRRSFIQPNSGFERQLKEYYKSNFDVRSRSRMEMIQLKALKHKYKLASAAIIVACMAIPLAIIV